MWLPKPFYLSINLSTHCQICVCVHVGVRVFAIKDIIFKLLCHMRRSHMQIEMAQHAVTYQRTKILYIDVQYINIFGKGCVTVLCG